MKVIAETETEIEMKYEGGRERETKVIAETAVKVMAETAMKVIAEAAMKVIEETAIKEIEETEIKCEGIKRRERQQKVHHQIKNMKNYCIHLILICCHILLFL